MYLKLKVLGLVCNPANVWKWRKKCHSNGLRYYYFFLFCSLRCSFAHRSFYVYKVCVNICAIHAFSHRFIVSIITIVFHSIRRNVVFAFCHYTLFVAEIQHTCVEYFSHIHKSNKKYGFTSHSESIETIQIHIKWIWTNNIIIMSLSYKITIDGI